MSFPRLTKCHSELVSESNTKEKYNMKNLSIILSSLTALLGLLVGIAPYTFAKVCGMANMHCHKVTAPTVLVFGILIFVLSLVQAAILWKKR